MPLIYHYCRPETFLQIIEQKKLWLSATNNMNDFAEDKWVESALQRALNKMINDTNLEWCKEIWSAHTVGGPPKYVACFSTDNDSLSQWRAYAQDGEGVAIGFDEERLGLNAGSTLHGKKRIKLNEIEYLDTHELEREISHLLQQGYERRHEGESYQDRLNDELNELGLRVKNPAFEEEKEKRIIYWPSSSLSVDIPNIDKPDQLSDVKYRVTSGYLTSYYEFDFSNLEVISDVMLGPKNKFTEYDVFRFLDINGLPFVKPGRSSATYR